MKRLRVLIVCLLLGGLIVGCGKESPAGEKGKDATANSFFKGNEIYRNGNVYSEKYALYTEYTDKGRTKLWLLDTTTGQKALYCFDAGCEHKPGRVNIMTGEQDAEGCIAYSFGGNTFSLRDTCSYFCQYPDVIRADREGRNRRNIARLGAECVVATGELYTENDYFRSYLCTEELIELKNPDGTPYVVFGEPLEKRIAGIKGVSLLDGSVYDVFTADDLYDLTIHELSVYRDRLYFICTGLDVPFDTLPHSWEDYDAYCKAQKEHGYVSVYEYDIPTKQLRQIVSEKPSGGYYFCDGYLVRTIEPCEAELLRVADASLIRKLPFPVSTIITSDRYVLASYMDYEKNCRTYYQYDPDSDRLLNTVSIGFEDPLFLNVVGDSYYGIYGGQICYISANDFWNGALDRKIILKVNEND